MLKQIEDNYKGKVRIAFKHLPLPFHDNAQLAAEASMAANEQGKFWEYHDKLFANQQALDRPSLEKYAQELGLNMAQVQGRARLGQVQDQVEADARKAPPVGATGTPTFFVNGTKRGGRAAVRRVQDHDRRRAEVEGLAPSTNPLPAGRVEGRVGAT